MKLESCSLNEVLLTKFFYLSFNTFVVDDPTQLVALRQAIANNFGLIAYAQADYQQATQHYEKSLQLARQAGDREPLSNY